MNYNLYRKVKKKKFYYYPIQLIFNLILIPDLTYSSKPYFPFFEMFIVVDLTPFSRAPTNWSWSSVLNNVLPLLLIHHNQQYEEIIYSRIAI